MKIRNCLIGVACLLAGTVSCERQDPVPDPVLQPEEPEKQQEDTIRTAILTGLQRLPQVFIDTPGSRGVSSKTEWVRLATIRIVGDEGAVLFEQDSIQIRGRGNSTWWNYPKKPYALKLDHQADFLGTGKSRRWVLLANWMDRTLLRNDVAFEAARRTSMEWTPSGTFVELYLDGKHLGNYWLGEKINVEGSKFKADYLFSMDTSDSSEWDFWTSRGFRPNSWAAGLPVEVKHPDRDDFPGGGFPAVLSAAETFLTGVEEGIYGGGDLSTLIDVDSFCDWYLVHELCYNLEPNHPKSCYFHVRDGVLIAGPVWDFDWNTFTPGHSELGVRNSIYFKELLSNPAFVARLRERWKELKPSFVTLGDYVDARASEIRTSEAANHQMWPCYPNPVGDSSRMVNHDENLTFQEAVDRLKAALAERIQAMDAEIGKL